MTILQAILLGALQGATEFFPVSSSGHLVVMRVFFGIQEPPVLFDVLLHVPTLIVVVLVFRSRIGKICMSFYRWVRGYSLPPDQENVRLLLWLVCASLATVGIGLGLSFALEAVRTSHRIVSILFFATGLILVATIFARGRKGYLQMSFWDALIIGCAQGLGVLPGVSRSGITISASLVRDLDREQAGEFAFLLAIPAIVGAVALNAGEAGVLLDQVDPLVLAAGCGASFVVGLASLAFLLMVVKRGRLHLFSVYLLPLAILTFILF